MTQPNRRSHLALAATAVAALVPMTSVSSQKLPEALPATVSTPLQPARWLPRSTIASVSFAGLQNLSKWGKEHQLVSLLETTVDQLRPALGERQERVINRIRRQLNGAAQQIGTDVRGLRELLAGQILIGVGRPAIVDEHPMPSLVAVIDCRNRSAAIPQLANALERLVRSQTRGSGARTRETIDGHQVSSIEGASLWWTDVDGVVVLSQSRGCLLDCLRVHAGKANFAVDQSAGARPERTVANLQVHTTPLRQAMAWVLPYEAEPILKAVGWTSVDGASISVGVGRERGDELVARIGAKLPADGLVRAAIGQPATHDAARLCSKDSLLYATGRFDVRSALQAGKRVLQAMPESLRREIKREVVPELSRELRHIGVSVPEMMKLAQLLGPQWTLSMSAPGGARLVPEALAIVESPQPETLVKVLVRAIGSADAGELKTTEFRGQTIHYLTGLPGGIPVTPAIAAVGQSLLIGSTLGAVKAAVRRAEAGAAVKNSLEADPEFQTAVAAEAEASMFAMVRLRNSLPRFYRMLQPMAEGFVERELGLDPDLIPSSEDLIAALADVRVGCTFGDDGMVLRVRGPIGSGALLVAGNAMLEDILEGGAKGGGSTGAAKKQKKGRIY